MICFLIICMVLSAIIPPAVSGENLRNSHYITNQPPLYAKMFTELPLGAIRARGWLHEQLQTMARGMTGHLDEVYPQVVGPRNGGPDSMESAEMCGLPGPGDHIDSIRMHDLAYFCLSNNQLITKTQERCYEAKQPLPFHLSAVLDFGR